MDQLTLFDTVFLCFALVLHLGGHAFDAVIVVVLVWYTSCRCGAFYTAEREMGVSKTFEQMDQACQAVHWIRQARKKGASGLPLACELLKGVSSCSTYQLQVSA